MATPDRSPTGRSESLEASARWECAAVGMLHRLNAEWMRAFTDANSSWFSKHLRDDFVCILADGSRIDKHEFLDRAQEHCGAHTVGCDEVDVHLVVDGVALVHGVIHHRSDDSIVLVRYTTIWQTPPRRWQAVATQLTQLNQPPAAAFVRADVNSIGPGARRKSRPLMRFGWRRSGL